MLPSELTLDNIKNNSFTDVVFGRRCARYLDPDYVIPREEIEQIMQETLCVTPTAVNTQPYTFLIVDNDEGKQKLDSVMRGTDRDRVTNCSFAVVPMADRLWYETYDEFLKIESETNPDYIAPMADMLRVGVFNWVDELTEGDGAYLDKSVNFQAGMAAMSFQDVCRAHGYDVGVMDNWYPGMLHDVFGIDLDRFIPEVVICVGKNTGSLQCERYRYPAEEKIIWG
jgi:nitroreductase